MTYDPGRDWKELCEKLREIGAACANQGVRVSRVEILGRVYPTFELLVPGGAVRVEFPEYEAAKNRVFGLR